jgi:hypothetical protein
VCWSFNYRFCIDGLLAVFYFRAPFVCVGGCAEGGGGIEFGLQFLEIGGFVMFIGVFVLKVD